MLREEEQKNQDVEEIHSPAGGVLACRVCQCVAVEVLVFAFFFDGLWDETED